MSRRFNASLVIVVIVITGLLGISLLLNQEDATDPLDDVEFWAYQIQGLDDDGAIQELASSSYDLLVIEPTRSDKENLDFDTRGAVEQLHATGSANLQSKLVIAYVDIGEAEDWRWYWQDDWTAPTETEKGIPDFMISLDPDGWEGNYPVAFWDERWKDVMLYDENSSIQQILDDGFDGIYMDWIEAYEHEPVAEEAIVQGVDPHQEMVDFIEEIRIFCRAQNPDFILIAQNALDMPDGHAEYYGLIDAVAQEHVLFDGVADTEWGFTEGGDIRVPENDNEGYSTQWYVEKLNQFISAGVRVFVVDYALDADNISESYEFSSSHGYIGFVTQISLSQLPDSTPPDYPSVP